MAVEDKTVLGSAQIEAALRSLNGWRRDGNTLVREWKFEKFAQLMPFLRSVLDTMDQNNHHSDLAVDSRTKILKVSVTTHSTGTITQSDVDFATAVDVIDVYGLGDRCRFTPQCCPDDALLSWKLKNENPLGPRG